MNASLHKAQLFFGEGILHVCIGKDEVIDVDDLIFMYCYGLQESKNKPFAVLFDTINPHELTEEAIVYLAKKTINHNIIAIAYLCTSMISRVRLSLFLIFEKPIIKPKTFYDKAEAHAWLKEQLISTELVNQD